LLELNKIYCGANSEILKQIDSGSINCCITSPPYWALRDYGVEGQLGLGPTFEKYINKLCNIFDGVKRILKKDGTCWVIIGDTYSTVSGRQGKGDLYGKQPKFSQDADNSMPIKIKTILPDKSLIMIPFRFAIEMVNRGWILRNTIIWYKPNCMPASVKDRFTVDFEYVFFFVKNKKYWFEQQFEPMNLEYIGRYKYPVFSGNKHKSGMYSVNGSKHTEGIKKPNAEGRNKRCVWQVPPKSFSGAHFAVYPEELIEPIIKAGCPENGIVLDPFMGRGTTAIVAKKQGKNFIGIDINPKYCDMANREIANTYRQLELIK